jgi:secreted effector protein SseD
MKKSIFLALTIALAGCQTGQVDDNPAAAPSVAGSRKAQNRPTKETACADAAKKAAQAQTNAALLGGVLSMAGGLGGLAGNGGVIAGQAASIGGSVLQSQATSSARASVAENCYG